MGKQQTGRWEFQNKAVRLLLSSVKEVVFIVAGILIALYINDWDANRKSIKTAQDFIKDVNADLKRDTTVFGAENRKIDLIIKSQTYILNNSNLDNVSTEDIAGTIGGGFHNIKINDASFNRMKNSDVFHLEKYEEIFKKFNIYYSVYETYLGNRNEWEVKLQETSLKYLVYQDKMEVNFDNKIIIVQDAKARRRAFLVMLHSIEGRNNLKLTLRREEGQKEVYENIFAAATKLVQKTDSILIKLKMN
jgi:hypothetical protein